MTEKYMPKVGDKLYLRQRTGRYYVDACRHPYTVFRINKNDVYIRECECIFPHPCYYDTLPTEIRDDVNGRVKKLRWSDKYQRWQESPAPYGTKYAEFAVFGEWDYFPYLD